MNTNMTRKSIDKKRPLEEMRQPSMSSADQPSSQSDNNPAFMLLLFPHSFTLACSLYTKWFVCSQYDWQSCWEKELKEVPSPLLLPPLLLLLLLLQLGSVSYARNETFCKYKVWFIVLFFWRCETFIEINGNALRHWKNGYNFENYNRRSWLWKM